MHAAELLAAAELAAQQRSMGHFPALIFGDPGRFSLKKKASVFGSPAECSACTLHHEPRPSPTLSPLRGANARREQPGFAEIDSDNNATEDSDSEDPYVASEKESPKT